jgi:transcriptional regulator with XRE-family HTH domain
VLRRGPRPGRALELSLRAMREAAGKTQAEIGAALGSDQAEMSKLERPDMMLSTLRRYAEALGARCDVVNGMVRAPVDLRVEA